MNAGPARRWRLLAGAALLSLGVSAAAQAPVYGYEVVAAYPHDPGAFTQGLAFAGGSLYEGTGLEGRSSLRRVELESGRVLDQRALAARYFGEGVTVFGARILQLTWRTHLGFIYARDTLETVGSFNYPGEGWGLTHDGRNIIMSDGTSVLHFLDPASFVEVRRVRVVDGGRPVAALNELEYVHGEIYANVWRSDRIARIDPAGGRVTGWIDLTGLLAAGLEKEGNGPGRPGRVDVLNGIAFDAEHDRLFVTGKLWPKLFEIRLVRRR